MDCGLNRVIMKHKKGLISFEKIDPVTSPFLLVMYFGGKGSIFENKGDRKSMDELVNDPVYRKFLEQIKRQCTRILAHLNKLGV